jgi:hypothetical protein
MKKILIQLAFSIIFLFVSSHTINAQWVQTNGPYGGTINALAVSGSDVFAGTDSGGVFLSTNNGTSWTAVNSGLMNSRVYSFSMSEGNIFAGTDGGGVWRRPLSEMVGVINDKPLPQLSQQAQLKIRSPEIATSPATITFSLLQPENVNLAVYTMSGHEIASLVNKNFESGLHHVQWNTRNVAAGFYIIRMQAGSNSLTKSFPMVR